MTFQRPTAQNALLDLTEYKACEYWLHSFRSPATGRIYTLGLKLFCRFHRTDPDKIIKMRPEQIERLLMEYIVYLKKNAVQTGQQKPQLGRIHQNSVANYLSGVKHFLKRSYGRKSQMIDWQKISDMTPQRLRTEYRSYTKDEIRSLLDIANLRMKLIILLMTSGGMRVGALPALKFRHIRELPNGMGSVSIYADSAKDHYFSFLTVECMAALKRWKEYRILQGETVNDDSFILRDHFGRNSRKTNRARPLKVTSIMRRMRQLVVKVIPNTDDLQSDHAFRKYADTCFVNSDVNQTIKELILGHSTGLDEIYYDEKNPASREKLLAEYIKANDQLTIADEYRLKKEVETLKEELAGAAPQALVSGLAAQVSNLQNELAEMRRRICGNGEPLSVTEMERGLIATGIDISNVKQKFEFLKGLEREGIIVEMRYADKYSSQ